MVDADTLDGFERRRRRLPHWEEPGATYFARFSLLQPPVVDLTRSDVAPMVIEALRDRDGRQFWLYDYVVMPDHIHAIVQPVTHGGRTRYLWRLMQSLKGRLGHRINMVLHRVGPVWLDETYDHIIRDQAEYERLAEYILHNPRMAGLIDDPTEWPWWGAGLGLQG